jgi:thiosulfate/3-mercaptopyruvate sulfurtransferase
MLGRKMAGQASRLVPVDAALVDPGWLAEHAADGDVVVADVRGPNAHARGHIPGSIPLVLGSPPPSTEREVLETLASEVALRLRRHGVTGRERLVLYDGGDGVSASAAAQLAELAGHPSVAVLSGGLGGWPGELEAGAVELEPQRVEFTARLDAVATREEIASRLGELALVDVRRDDEYSGKGGYPCDPRQGHIPGARHVDVALLYAAPGVPRGAAEVRELVGLPDGSELVAYCHSGSRSGLAVLALRAAGYRARNYPGSWHEWSRHKELPAER